MHGDPITLLSGDQRSKPLRILCYAIAGASVLFLLVHAHEPLRLNWGDPWSDANVLTALKYSYKYGFIHTSFTDVLDVGPLTAESYRYTHYPPLAEIFYGVVHKIAGETPIGTYRWFAIGFSLGGLLFLRRYVTMLFGATTGALAMALAASNLLWLQYADSIHQAPLMMMSGFAALTCIAGALQGQPSRGRLAAIGATTFACYLASYDFFFFLPLAAVATALLCRRRLRERTVLLCLGMVVLGAFAAFVTKSAFVIGALGWHGWAEDLAFQSYRAQSHDVTGLGRGFFVTLFHRFLLYFTPLFFALLAYHVIALARRGRGWLQAPDTASALYLLAGLPFLVLFFHLTALQVLGSQVLLPYYAIAGATLLARGFAAGRGPRLWAGAAFVGILAWQTVHAAAFQRSLLQDSAVAAVRNQLREHDRNDFLVSNLLQDGPIQAYFDRRFMPPPRRDSTQWYTHLVGSLASEQVTIVYFTDPNALFIDKTLSQLLARDHEWTLLGNPIGHRARIMEALGRYQSAVLDGIVPLAREATPADGVRIFTIDRASIADYLRKTLLREPTRVVRFGEDRVDALMAYGFRWSENASRWTVPHTLYRTHLTRHWNEWLPVAGAPKMEAAVLVHLEASRGHHARMVVSGAYDGQWLSVHVNGSPELVRIDLGTALDRHTVELDVPAQLLHDDGMQRIEFEFGGVNAAGVGVSFESLEFD